MFGYKLQVYTRVRNTVHAWEDPEAIASWKVKIPQAAESVAQCETTPPVAKILGAFCAFPSLPLLYYYQLRTRDPSLRSARQTL
jgi:hypothetical protein